MAKAAPVRGIKTKKSLQVNARLVVESRLKEFILYRSILLGEPTIEQLHDMRITAKRLRYALETFDICFPRADKLVKELSQVQEDLGTIHDLDVMTAMLQDRYARLDADISREAVEIASTSTNRADQFNRLRSLIATHSRDRRRLGLLVLLGDRHMRRAKKFRKFREEWTGERLDEFERQVRASLRGEDVTPDFGPESRTDTSIAVPAIDAGTNSAGESAHATEETE